MSGLEFCLSGGAAHGAVLTGALMALRQRGVVPDVVTGISSGSMAAVLAYGSGDLDRAEAFFRRSFELVRGRGPRALLPPYRHDGASVIQELGRFVDAPARIQESGLRELWVGVTRVPLMRWEQHELLAAGDASAMVTQLARTSMMPFLTHDTLHLQRGLDGAFRKNHFAAPGPRRERWLFTYANKPLTSGRGPRGAYDRVVLLRSPFRLALDLDVGRIERALGMGLAQGAALDLMERGGVV